MIRNLAIKRLFVHCIIAVFLNVDKKCGQVLSWNQYLFLLTDLLCCYGNILLDVLAKVYQKKILRADTGKRHADLNGFLKDKTCRCS